jgi:hypothetical protein
MNMNVSMVYKDAFNLFLYTKNELHIIIYVLLNDEAYNTICGNLENKDFLNIVLFNKKTFKECLEDFRDTCNKIVFFNKYKNTRPENENKVEGEGEKSYLKFISTLINNFFNNYIINFKIYGYYNGEYNR